MGSSSVAISTCSDIRLVLGPLQGDVVCIYAYMIVCMVVCMYVCMYGCMYVCMDGWMDGWMDG